MRSDKNGILNRAKAAQQTAVVMDEGLRAVSYTHLRAHETS